MSYRKLHKAHSIEPWGGGKNLRGSFATKQNRKGEVILKIPELARKLLNWGDMPRNLTDHRAQEIALLAQAYLNLRAILRKQKGLK